MFDQDIFKVTLFLFFFSLYGGVMLNTGKKIVYSFDDALLMENHNLDIAFSYAVSIDSTLFIL